jgi:hypothetical protein
MSPAHPWSPLDVRTFAPEGWARAPLPADAPPAATEAYRGPAGELVILGLPDPEGADGHHCDALGCQQAHVLERRAAPGEAREVACCEALPERAPREGP